jgi:hypothetical protein
MRRPLLVSVVLATVAALVVTPVFAAGASGSGTSTPRWVKHVRNYPGGIDNTVRVTLRKGVIQASSTHHRATGPVGTAGRAGTASVTNVQVNADSNPPLPQNEEQVAYSTDDPSTAVVATNDYVDGGLFIGTTHDGGNTWRSWFEASRFAATGDFCSGGDPSVVYSARDHAFYASQLCFFRVHPESSVEVIQSTDGGNTWTPARYSSEVISNANPDGSIDDSVFYDKEQIAVDNNPSSPFYGRLYVTFTKFHMEPSGFSDYCPIQVAWTNRLDPNGDGDLRDAAWGHNAVMPDNPGDNGVSLSSNQGSQPVVDNQGGLDISFMQEDCNTSLDRKILFNRSTDGGASFQGVVQVNKGGQWKDNPNKSDLLPDKNARFPASTSAPLVFNPVTNALEFVTQNYVNANGKITGTPTGQDISFTQSLNYGTTWSKMRFVSVNGDGTPAAEDQALPWMAVDASGATHIIWLDNRNDPNNVMFETFRVVTSDVTDFTANEDISTVPWDPNASFFGSGAFVGDYNGIAAYSGGGSSLEYPMWVDGRNTLPSPHGQTDIFTVPNPSS